jgi:hypothetical protein
MRKAVDDNDADQDILEKVHPAFSSSSGCPLRPLRPSSKCSSSLSASSLTKSRFAAVALHLYFGLRGTILEFCTGGSYSVYIRPLTTLKMICTDNRVADCTWFFTVGQERWET